MQTRKLIFRLLLIIAITALLVSVFCVSASAMQITMQVEGGGGEGYLTASVEATDSVEDIKARIYDWLGALPDEYSLVYFIGENPILLEDGKTLQDYMIQDGAVLYVVYHQFINCECYLCHKVRPHTYSDCTDVDCDNDGCRFERDDAQPSHAFDDCFDADCNNTDCSFTREPATEHVFSDCTDTVCDNDGCTVTRVAESAHSFDDCLDSACNNDGCPFVREVSGKHAFDSCLDSDCNNEGCPFTREPATEHIFTDCTDKSCDSEDCPFEREANATHIFDGCTDTVCDTPGCPFVREANATHIFDGCLDTDCNSKDCPFTREAKPHEGGAATCVRPAVCESCGNEYGDIKPHTASSEWVITDTHHYHRCKYWSEISSCNEKYNNEEHKYADWVVTKEADVLITGEMERECLCGHKDYESIPAKPMFEGPITATEWIVLAAAVAVVLIVSAVCWYINKP